MNEEQFILLAIKVLSGNHLPEEETELHRQLELSPAYRKVYEGLSTYWQIDEYPAIDTEAALGKTWGKIDRGQVHDDETSVIPIRRPKTWKLRVAAALLPLIAVSFWLFHHKQPPVEWAEKYNPNGVRSMIILPDGTRVWLNADSKLAYPVAFSEHEREIRLNGEAFLDVAKDAARPFIVRLLEGTVHVLGTSFDIRAYKEEEETKTSVASGLVAFISNNAKTADSVVVHSNEEAVLDNHSGSVKVSETDAAADHGWINGVLAFNNQPLREIAKELERYFGKPIVFKNEHVASYRYTAIFRNNSEEEILTTLKKVKSFHFKITDKNIEIDR